MKDPFAKYLDRYAEHEVNTLGLAALNTHRYAHVIVIPAYDEAPKFVDQLLTQLTDVEPTLIICVINTPTGSHDHDAYLRTVNLWQALSGSGKADLGTESTADEQTHCLIERWKNTPVDLLLINRFTNGQQIPERQGVGLARKIGNDVATALIAKGIVTSEWIHNTDADATLPKNYLSETLSLEASAYYLPFIHETHSKPSCQNITSRNAVPQNISTNMALYELSLHYYVLGLQWAESPYGFHTIGSTLILNAAKYCAVRGFPKRNGGEDFHLLNKLAKVGSIRTLGGQPIIINGRESHRVPFGTGPALKEIATLTEPLANYRYYHPQTFVALHCWQNSIERVWKINEQDPNLARHELLHRALNEANDLSVETSAIQTTLEALGIYDALKHAFAQSKNTDHFQQHLAVWFDGLKTLKFVHGMEKRGYPRQCLNAIAEHPIMVGGSKTPQWITERVIGLRRMLLSLF